MYYLTSTTETDCKRNKIKIYYNLCSYRAYKSNEN